MSEWNDLVMEISMDNYVENAVCWIKFSFGDRMTDENQHSLFEILVTQHFSTNTRILAIQTDVIVNILRLDYMHSGLLWCF